MKIEPYYSDDLLTLYHGDCTEILCLLPKSNLIIADPPFNVGKEFDDDRTDEEYYEWCELWVKECWDACADNGSFFLMTIQQHVSDMMYYLCHNGHLRNIIVWFNSSMPVKNKFCVGYQPILYYTKSKDNFVFNYGAEKRQSSAVLPWGRENKSHSIKDIWDDIPFISAGCMASKEAILRPGTKKKAHSAQMPEALAARMIKYCTNENDLVVDPFCGSGTTLIAARDLNRRAIGIERSKEYCQLIVDRIKRPKREFDLFGE